MGCPYSSKVTFEDQPTEKVNEAYFGNYEKKGSTTYTYELLKETSKTYLIKEKSNTGTSVYYYIGYIIKIDETDFLITYEKPKEGKEISKYYFYKFEGSKSGSMFTLSEVTENIKEQFNDPKELRNYFKKYKDISFFYDKTETKYYRLD